MSVHPTPPVDPGAYSAVITWNVPIGSKIHEIKFSHGFSAKTFELEIDNANKQSFFFVKPPSLMDHFCCCCSSVFYATPIETKFKFEGFNLTVWVTAEQSEFEYTLKVNNQDFKDYQDSYYKKFDTWIVNGLRIVLDKETLDVWCNGEALKDVARNFVDDGTCVNFDVDQIQYQIRTQGDKSSGISHALFVNDELTSLDKTFDTVSRTQNAKMFLTMHRVGIE